MFLIKIKFSLPEISRSDCTTARSTRKHSVVVSQLAQRRCWRRVNDICDRERISLWKKAIWKDLLSWFKSWILDGSRDIYPLKFSRAVSCSFNLRRGSLIKIVFARNATTGDARVCTVTHHSKTSRERLSLATPRSPFEFSSSTGREKNSCSRLNGLPRDSYTREKRDETRIIEGEREREREREALWALSNPRDERMRDFPWSTTYNNVFYLSVSPGVLKLLCGFPVSLTK